MRYTVEPGLYAMGRAGASSPVLVTANYKLTFDVLRRELPGRDLWILVLDTKGVNVWCAAGKGTFGTVELLARLEASGVARVIDHRDLIVPQLGAPGVSAHQVKKSSGFRVIYGPIRAADLPAFLEAGLVATPKMRRKTFPARERIALIPIELVAALKWLFFILGVFFVIGGLAGAETFWTGALRHGSFAAAGLSLALLFGAVLTPLLLPFIPGRAFSLKGFFLSIPATVLLAAWGLGAAAWPDRLEKLGWAFLIPAMAAYLAMNFTGASTYTSLSGVKKEMRRALPLEIAGGIIGVGLWVGSFFCS